MSKIVASVRSIWKLLPRGVRHGTWTTINGLRDGGRRLKRLLPVRAEGMTWQLPQSFTSNSISALRDGDYERDERDVLKTVLSNLNGSTPAVALDFGTHIGRVALTLARRMGSDTRIICVEADPRTIGPLRRNLRQIAKLHKLPPIALIQGAIAAPGQTEGKFLQLRGLGSGLASSRANDGSGNAVKVKTLSVGDVLREHNVSDKPFIASLDIEGGEFDAFKDVTAFKNCVGIAVEIHEPAITGMADAEPETLVKTIEGLGFELARDASGNVAHRGRVYGFVRKGLALH